MRIGKIWPVVVFAIMMLSRTGFCESNKTEDVFIWLEAEQGLLKGGAVAGEDKSASNGKYVTFPENAKAGDVSYIFEAPSGAYKVWGRVEFFDGRSDSFFVAVDGGRQAAWHFKDWYPVYMEDTLRRGRETATEKGLLNPGQWFWSYCGAQFVLKSSGKHVLKIIFRESRARLDKILITNCKTYEPKDLGEKALEKDAAVTGENVDEILREKNKEQPVYGIGKVFPAEKEIFQDKETGRTVWRMTDNIGEDFHTYYNLDPWSPDNSKILFNSSRSGSLQVWMMNDDGSQITQLTDEIRPPREAIWSKKGDEIYYYTENSENVIYAVNVNTFKKRVIVSLPAGSITHHYSLSPDGKYICFYNFKKVMLVNTENGQAEELNPDFDLQSRKLTIAPSGTQQARFTNARDNSLYWGAYGCITDIEGEVLCEWKEDAYAFKFNHADWSPDGGRIVGGLSSKEGLLWVINRDGTGMTMISKNVQGHHSWSPDGKWVVVDAYAHSGETPIMPYYNKIVLVAADGSQETRVLCNVNTPYHLTYRGQYYHGHPHFNRDGTKVMFVSVMKDNDPEIYVVLVK